MQLAWLRRVAGWPGRLSSALRRGVSGVALVSCAAYLALATVSGDQLPLIQFEMFRFAAAKQDMVVPLFLADGRIVDVEAYTDFAELPGERIDVEHRGYGSSVEHKFQEARYHLRRHQGNGGPVTFEIGVIILSLGPDGEVRERRRVDARGSARAR